MKSAVQGVISVTFGSLILVALAACDTGGPEVVNRRPDPGLRTEPFEPSLSVTFAEIELGYGHTCGLLADGRAFCMGDNEYGQLGSSAPMQRCKDGQFPCSQTPLAVEGGHVFRQLGMDQRDGCGLTSDGIIYCWGFGDGGQLGDGLRTSSVTPVMIQGATRYRYLGRGQAASNLCAISVTGNLYCWGIGIAGDVAPVPTAVASGLAFSEIGSGQEFACALAESGDIYCWGSNSFGKLGTGVAGSTTVPALVSGGLAFTALAVGGQHACGLAADGQAWCWGFPDSVGSAAPVNGAETPQVVSGGHAFKRITAGFQHTCAIDMADQAWCWGGNLGGAIGDGTTTDRIEPVPVATSERFALLSAGGTATCGLTLDGRLFCWGLNSYGQLGFEPSDP